MRLYEKIINKRIQDFLKKNKIIIKQQSGFRQNRQTKDNLIFLTQKAIEATNKKFRAISIFFDIQAAFDKVWHRGLIYKLAKINLPTYLIEWIINFLSDRQFKVKINDHITENFPIKCGVPQGACLSPTLFSIFINDIPIEHVKYSRYGLLFADDLVKLYIFRNTTKDQTVEREINEDLLRLTSWTNKWRLTLATHKCSYMCFKKFKLNETVDQQSKKRKRPIKATNISKSLTLNLYINNNVIQYEPVVKFLGIQIDEYCRFDHQIKHIKSVFEQTLLELQKIYYN
jgi:hypothetical protein